MEHNYSLVTTLSNKCVSGDGKQTKMDTARYPRKTGETSVKKHFIKMLKDVGMVVLKIKETR